MWQCRVWKNECWKEKGEQIFLLHLTAHLHIMSFLDTVAMWWQAELKGSLAPQVPFVSASLKCHYRRDQRNK